MECCPQSSSADEGAGKIEQKSNEAISMQVGRVGFAAAANSASQQQASSSTKCQSCAQQKQQQQQQHQQHQHQQAQAQYKSTRILPASPSSVTDNVRKPDNTNLCKNNNKPKSHLGSGTRCKEEMAYAAGLRRFYQSEAEKAHLRAAHHRILDTLSKNTLLDILKKKTNSGTHTIKPHEITRMKAQELAVRVRQGELTGERLEAELTSIAANCRYLDDEKTKLSKNPQQQKKRRSYIQQQSPTQCKVMRILPASLYSDTDKARKPDTNLCQTTQAKTPLRSGAWSPEEVKYAELLRQLFLKGSLNDCKNGTKFLTYLSHKLQCTPSRIREKNMFPVPDLGNMKYTHKCAANSTDEIRHSEAVEAFTKAAKTHALGALSANSLLDILKKKTSSGTHSIKLHEITRMQIYALFGISRREVKLTGERLEAELTRIAASARNLDGEKAMLSNATKAFPWLSPSKPPPPAGVQEPDQSPVALHAVPTNPKQPKKRGANQLPAKETIQSSLEYSGDTMLHYLGKQTASGTHTIKPTEISRDEIHHPVSRIQEGKAGVNAVGAELTSTAAAARRSISNNNEITMPMAKNTAPPCSACKKLNGQHHFIKSNDAVNTASLLAASLTAETCSKQPTCPSTNNAAKSAQFADAKPDAACFSRRLRRRLSRHRCREGDFASVLDAELTNSSAVYQTQRRSNPIDRELFFGVC